MSAKRFLLEFESPSLPVTDPALGTALGRVADALSDLEPLWDFYTPDPREVARKVGMVSPLDPSDEDDLEEIDFGPQDWYEAAAGYAAVAMALRAIHSRPEAVAEAVYDPSVTADDVIHDLEAIESLLSQARDHEIRFHFIERA